MPFLSLLLAACAGGAPDPSPPADHPDTADTSDSVNLPDGDPATITLAGACPLATRYGGFEIVVNDDYSTVSGAVADGVVPITVLVEAAREDASPGDSCVLLRRDNPYCEPTCDPGETCDFDGACLPYPANQDLGTIDVLGLREGVSMQPVVPGNTYFDTTLPHPVVDPDALVELRAAGAPGFTLRGVGPEALVPSTLAWVIGGAPLALAWNAPTGLGRSTIELRLTVDQHGLTPLTLVCEFADDGTADIPPALVEELLVSGVSGYPNGRISRRTADKVAVGAGCADLVVGYEVLPNVTVDGHTACDSHDDCPSGQHCNFPLETCE
ncbi:MAG: hypothetical protein Q8P18_22405 [Pseudomonadota bacterium]|nr:hypothetical protein [Pseudomonadota bacterium]